MDRRFLTAVTFLVAIGMVSCLFGSVNGLKPEIQHKFREPEKRPPVVVTTFFTLLVASPVLILFTFWSKSVSLKFESLTLSRIIFHALFFMVLACYTNFWLGTNMFDTMRYTGPLICALFYFYK
jgi:oligosaccharyltransferase complex subunit delta (ribophorin II)